MKKVFETPEIEVIKFGISENITADDSVDIGGNTSDSGGFGEGDEDDFIWE